MSRTPGSGLIRGTCALAIACAAACAAGCGDVQPGSGTARGAHAGTAAGSVGAATAGAPASVPASATPPAATGTTPATTGTAPRKRPVAPAHPVPAAFRPAAGAPSDAEVERELAQLGTVQREEHERLLSAAAANLAGLLPWADEPKSGVQVSVASVFTDYGLGLACGGLLGREQLGVAHKTAPCGTLITFTYNGRSLTVPVIDRGPYIAGREWDLTGATARALGFPGLGQIAWSLAR